MASVLTNHYSHRNRGSSLKRRMTVALRLSTDLKLLMRLPKRRALAPSKEDFGLFFELAGHQQETLYFVVQKVRKGEECEGREASEQPLHMNKEGSSWVWNVWTLSVKNSSNGFENVPHIKSSWCINFLMTKAASVRSVGRRKRLNCFNTWFLEEAYLYLEGTVNKQNMLFWETEPPENAHEESSHRRKIAVWVAMSAKA